MVSILRSMVCSKVNGTMTTDSPCTATSLAIAPYIRNKVGVMTSVRRPEDEGRCPTRGCDEGEYCQQVQWPWSRKLLRQSCNLWKTDADKGEHTNAQALAHILRDLFSFNGEPGLAAIQRDGRPSLSTVWRDGVHAYLVPPDRTCIAT